MKIVESIKNGFHTFFRTEYAEKKILQLLAAVLAYSAFVGAATYGTQPPHVERSMTDRQELDGMLVRTKNGLHFYDFANLHENAATVDFELEPVDTVSPVAIAYDELSLSGSTTVTRTDAYASTSVQGDHMLLTRGVNGSQLFDAQAKKNYTLLEQPSDIVTVNDKKDILYTTAEGDYVLHYFFPACSEPYEIPLPRDDRDMPAVLRAMNLPAQKKLVLSPSQQSALVLDHAYQSRIALINTVKKQSLILFAPGFSETQIQFSPVFLNEDTVVFSVMDETRHGTVRYDIREFTYGPVSDDFIIEAYPPRTGGPRLLQSFEPRIGNVPFGSFALMNGKTKANRQEIVAMWGNSDAGWTEFFEDPESELMTFKKDANLLFPTIEDDRKRADMISYWSSLFNPFGEKQGEVRIMKLAAGTLSLEGAHPFAVSRETPYFLWREDVGLLLRSLSIPYDVVNEYENNAAAAKRANQTYEVLDLR